MRPGHLVQCVRRRAVDVRVVRASVPEPRVPLLRCRSENKKHSRATTSAAVRNAHGAVNDVEAAPCQPSVAYGRTTLPDFAESFRWHGLAKWSVRLVR